MERKREATSGGTGPVPPWPLDRHRFRVRYRNHVPSTTDALPAVVRDLVRVASSCGCGREQRTDIEIVVREALANAIIHGNGRHRGKRIFVRCYGAPQSAVLILVRDEGPGFDPANVPDPRNDRGRHLEHGRGLLLMRELADFVAHRKNGREVLMYKRCGRGAKRRSGTTGA